MRIVGISGVWSDNNPVWNTLTVAFKKEFPNSEFFIEEEKNCHPWQVRRMRLFCDSLIQKHDDGEEIILVGHSMGGVFACRIAERFQRSSMRGIVTIFSPHTFLSGVFTKALQAPDVLAIPIISFNARSDKLVLWGTKHPYATAHHSLNCDHYRILSGDPLLAQRIASVSRKEILRIQKIKT